MPASLHLGVIGHVEHITLGRVAALPGAGDIAHLIGPHALAGGGGGITFFQLVRSSAEVHLFTALGDDEAARFVEQAIGATGARIYAARRAQAHTRDIVMIGPDGDRTILVIGPPLHPQADDPLPWDTLDQLDGVYFTAQDPALLARARRARIVVATARRRDCIIASGVALDVIVGSTSDPRERSTRADYPVPPTAVIMTEGARGGTVETAAGVTRFAAPSVEARGGAYGAGDSFAGALTYYLAAGLAPAAAAERAAHHGAAVVSSFDPLTAQLALP
jgi:ribokinase